MAKKFQDIFSEIATRQGMTNFISQMEFLPDPDSVLVKSGKDITVYRDLSNDSHVYANIQQRKSGVMSMSHLLLGDAGAQLDLVNTAFKSLDLYGIINQMLNAVFFGYSVMEVLWEKRNGFILPRAVEEKPLEWFRFNQNNELVLRGKDALSNTLIAEYPYKFLMVQHNPTYMNPYGEKVLSRCFWPVTFKKAGLGFWAVFVEKYGMPHAIAQAARNSSDEEYSKILEALDNMIQDSVAVVPEGTQVKIEHATNTAASESYQLFIDFMNAEISKAILSVTLTTELKSGGSYAASMTHENMIDMLAESDKRLVCRGINQLIDFILKVNFANPQPIQFDLVAPERINLTRSERDERLKRMGVQFTESYYQAKYNLQESDFTLAKNTAAFAAPVPEPVLTTQTQLEQLQEPIDKLILGLLDKSNITQSMYNQILSAVQSAGSFDELTTALNELYPNLDVEGLGRLLEKALFISDIYGQMTVENKNEI